jgi:hypothetical protein
MHKFSVSKDMKKKSTMIKKRNEVAVSREGGGTLMSNTNYQRIEN